MPSPGILLNYFFTTEARKQNQERKEDLPQKYIPQNN